MFSETRKIVSYYYNLYRIFWMILSCAAIIHVIISSDEILTIYVNKTYINNYFYILSSLLILTNIIVRYYSIKIISKNLTVCIIISIFSFLFEFFFFSCISILTVVSLSIFPVNLISVTQGILYTVLPISLGATTLPAITMDYLEKRIESIKEKIKLQDKKLEKINKQTEELDLIIKEMEQKRNDALKKGE